MAKFFRAEFNAETKKMTAWQDCGKMIEVVQFWTYTQEDYEDYVTIENLTNYLAGATELPEDYESYEDWAQEIWNEGQQDEVLFDLSYTECWRDICHLAGVDEESIPYSSCCSLYTYNKEQEAA